MHHLLVAARLLCQLQFVGGAALSWKSQKQSTRAMGTAESEYMAACSVNEECRYFKSILQKMSFLTVLGFIPIVQ